MANLDRFILKLDSLERERSIKKTHDVNIKRRSKQLSHLE